MSPQVNIATWPNIEQVAAQTGISRRTIERELSAGKWRTQKRRRTNARPEVVFDPEQVASRMPVGHASVVKAVPATMAETAGTEEPITWNGVAELAGAICQQILGALMPAAEEEKTLYVGLDEASKITGLSVGCLRKRVKEGELTAMYDADKSRHYTVPKVRRGDL